MILLTAVHFAQHTAVFQLFPTGAERAGFLTVITLDRRTHLTCSYCRSAKVD